MLIIAIINQKGGVGKTTTTLNLGHALALRGQQVTLIDLDPQGHLSASLGVHDPHCHGMGDVLLDHKPLQSLALTMRDNLQLVPAGARLGEAERQMNLPRDRLQQALTGQFADQQCVLLDCPPSSGPLVVNALIAADSAIVPVVCDYLALHGLSYLMSTFKNFEKSLDKKIPLWIVLTRYQQRRRLVRDVQAKLMNYFPGRILATPIRENVALAESPSFGKSIFEYRAHSPGAEDYQQLADDLLNGRTL